MSCVYKETWYKLSVQHIRSHWFFVRWNLNFGCFHNEIENHMTGAIHKQKKLIGKTNCLEFWESKLYTYYGRVDAYLTLQDHWQIMEPNDYQIAIRPMLLSKMSVLINIYRFIRPTLFRLANQLLLSFTLYGFNVR